MSGYSGKTGLGGSQDHEYNPDMSQYAVKPRQSLRARAESVVFYAISLIAIVVMLAWLAGVL